MVKKRSSLKLAILALALVLIIGIIGCSGGRDTPVAENALKRKIERTFKQTDALLIYKIDYTNEGTHESLKRRIAKDTADFNKIKEIFHKASTEGDVIQSMRDHYIIFMGANKVLLKLDYCSSDGRLKEMRHSDTSPPMLFVPKSQRSIIN